MIIHIGAALRLFVVVITICNLITIIARLVSRKFKPEAAASRKNPA